ncbi:MAG: glycerophosphodiester phosphodiesterase [Acidimicrobiales bacterium]|nr:glycerophosphodiester phosphodiesterase [Actinomycetota bacterium]
MVRVIAHRGASAAAPENTIEAFHLARELGADWVELDVRRTADGAMVINHDDRLADGRAIVDLDRHELPEHVCELADALDACAGMSVNIEIKNFPGDADFDETESVAEAVVAEVRRRGSHAEVLVSCFHLPTLTHVRTLDPAIPTAFLHLGGESDWDGFAGLVAAGGHVALHPWDWLVDEALVGAAQRAGLEVNVWTVDDPERMAALIDLGVHGLCTNVPDVARRVVDGA